MSNLDQLKQVFILALALPQDTVVEDLQYNNIPEWDSIAHMSLIAHIDEAFDIMMDTEDIIDLSTFQKAQEILAKYGVTFS